VLSIRIPILFASNILSLPVDLIIHFPIQSPAL
jgi:hypothetical protein